MGVSRKEYWSGFPCPSPGELPHPGIEPQSPALQADALTSEPPSKESDQSDVPLPRNSFFHEHSLYNQCNPKPVLLPIATASVSVGAPARAW